MKSALTGTITIRLGAKSLRLLKARARKQRVTASDLVRELVDRELAAPDKSISAADLSRAWVGAMTDARLPSGRDARKALQDWSPDRRS